ncbi:uncharacterized protein BDZ99DRAFT_462616 [Mytilinidion resinicola]|uniref:Uncharacterized protein n=1 Tax=Mytilinidion resinicola TaxID=574789 RepID=A0A6A6YM97_9PEZI|nr:uncharacterized protein BDZ99DRAFT_462616 [Mytilinidion resinicola]KAF2810002.1 hypothetical protein BDZ99DRAFT_462616 [Mytilinidion resinicola]
MPRRSAKQVKASASRSSSKRPASPKATPIRQSKRAKATPAKSSYFEHDSDDEVDDAASEFAEDADGGKESVYDEDEAKTSPSPSAESDIEAEESDDEDETPRKKGHKAQPKKGVTMPIRGGTKDKDLWKTGANLPPGTQVIIKKPKAREAGDTPYTDDSIHPNTMLFLRDLAANNDRAWLKMHDPDYRASLQDFTTFLESLTQKVIEVDETIPELPVKDIIFRIYRDIRFSSDPTPYKTHFSAAWSRTGRKGPYAAYYVQIKPGGNLVGGGLWCPAAEPLSLLRRDIDRNPHNIKRVLTDAGIRRAFLGGVAGNEKKAVTAFCSQSENASNALKTKPKGYENDHKDIQLLRLRNFTIGTKLADDEVVGPKGLDRIFELLSCMVPFVSALLSLRHARLAASSIRTRTAGQTISQRAS